MDSQQPVSDAEIDDTDQVTTLRICGIGELRWNLTVDTTVARWTVASGRLRGAAPSAPDLVALARDLAEPLEPRWSAGGLVADTLATLASRQRHPHRLRAEWIGSVARRRHATEPPSGPVDDLRRRGVGITRARLIDHHPVHLVAMHDGRPIGRLSSAAVSGTPALPAVGGSDVTVLAEAGDLAACNGFAGRLVVLVGEPLSVEVAERLRVGVAGRQVLAVVGDEVALARSGVAPDCEVGRWVVVRTSHDPAALPAAAAAFLLDRMPGEVPRATMAGPPVPRGHGRPAHTDDLNAVFGHLTDRASTDHGEGRLFDRVRRAAGPIVVVGGQTGVNQVVLSVTAELGLPSFCVLPEGRRTERTEQILDGTDDFADAHVSVLAAHSYRHRTWTTVLLADGTMTWDPRRSEGSAAAREAADALGRPKLDLTDIAEDDMPAAVVTWIRSHGIRVVNIEGNRGSLLTEAQHVEARRQIGRVLRATAAAAAADAGRPVWPEGPVATAPRTAVPPLRIAAPAAAPVRRLLSAFLAEGLGIRFAISHRLVHDSTDPPLHIVLARSSDLPALVQEGVVDLIVCHGDVIEGTDVPTILETGLRPLHFGLVARAGVALPADARIGTQYAALAQRLLPAAGHQGPIRLFGGSAETWIVEGLVDAAFDSWHTGSTAEAHGLEMAEVLLSTSLVVAGSPTRDADWFLTALAAWIGGR